MTELENYLCSLRTFGVRPGLENTQNAIAALKDKHPGLPEPKFLHIAGTNGKGSTCAFLDSILKEANIKHGLFTS
ncbi:bifunctional folylpolyglutamate synthase/dihydrofolate synthase, partial [bacterium]|nr:bifunctional folylpolyglutamate synthase/dihydrofolate synthase [bacterium]